MDKEVSFKAIAAYYNWLWQRLTESKKAEIRRIIENAKPKSKENQPA